MAKEEICEFEARLAASDSLVKSRKKKATGTICTLAMDVEKRFEQTSRLKREFHERFCEGFWVKIPLTTRRNIDFLSSIALCQAPSSDCVFAQPIVH